LLCFSAFSSWTPPVSVCTEYIQYCSAYRDRDRDRERKRERERERTLGHVRVRKSEKERCQLGE